MSPAKKTPAKKKTAAKKAPAKLSASKAARERFATTFKKDHGDGALDTSGAQAPYEFIPTGCLDLDLAMGGGCVEGRLVEIWGVDAIGKTRQAIAIAAEAQRKHPNKLVAWIDMERTFDFAWARANGLLTDEDHFWIIRPQSAEDVADAMKDCLRSGLFSVVALDSIGAMIPEVEKQKDADEATMAVQAKIVTRMVKIAAVEAANTSTVVLMLNQVRANLGYGADTTTGGGFALKHVTTHKLKLSGTQTTPFTVKLPGEEKPVVVGFETAVLVERNKIAPPKRRATFVFFHTATDKYGPIGIDQADDVFSVGLKTKVITQSGGWYYPPGLDKLQGREATIEALRENPDVVAQIRAKALATLSGEIVVGEEADPLVEAESLGIEGLKSRFGSLTEEMAGKDDA